MPVTPTSKFCLASEWQSLKEYVSLINNALPHDYVSYSRGAPNEDGTQLSGQA